MSRWCPRNASWSTFAFGLRFWFWTSQRFLQLFVRFWPRFPRWICDYACSYGSRWFSPLNFLFSASFWANCRSSMYYLNILNGLIQSCTNRAIFPNFQSLGVRTARSVPLRCPTCRYACLRASIWDVSTPSGLLHAQECRQRAAIDTLALWHQQ